jgi:hypothetical protein
MPDSAPAEPRARLTEDAVAAAALAGDMDTVTAGLAQTGPAALDLARPVKWLETEHAVVHRAAWFVLWIMACRHGHVPTVQLLLSLTGNRHIHVHAQEELAFRTACARGHVDVVKLLLELKGARRINVHAKDDDALVWACKRGRADVVALLLRLGGARWMHPGAQEGEAYALGHQHRQRAVQEQLLQHPTPSGAPAVARAYADGVWGMRIEGVWVGMPHVKWRSAGMRRSTTYTAVTLHRQARKRRHQQGR